jgi:transcription factor TFIIIB component B''
VQPAATAATSDVNNEKEDQIAVEDTANEDPAKTIRMADLCDSFYIKKHSKGKKRKKSVDDGENGEPAAAKKPQKKITNQSAVAPKPSTEQTGGPRVEIVNGKIVVKESSLMLNNNAGLAEEEYEEVVEGVHATARYSSFTKRRHSASWGIEETRQFYDALRQCGLDFTMLQAFFPGRTRKQLKTKYFREEAAHPQLVKMALDNSLPLQLEPFEVHLGSLKEETESKGVKRSKQSKAQKGVEDAESQPPANAEEEEDVVEV